MQPLQESDAHKIASVWSYKSAGNEKRIEYMIRHNRHLGLYDKISDLVAWCLQRDSGSLGTLQVDEKHLRKGFGEIVTAAITKKIATECDTDVTANIFVKNYKSLNLFKKLGFQEIDHGFLIGVIIRMK